MSVRAGNRLLNILCLHGYGSNSAVFEYQSRLFRKTFSGSMSFHVLQAPFEVDDQPPPPAFAARGLLPPFYGWYRIGQHRVNEQGQHELQVRRFVTAVRVRVKQFVTSSRTSTCRSASRPLCSFSRAR